MSSPDLTGERPVAGSTPDSLLALHAAGYREVRTRLGSGRMLDVGCGLGDGTATFLDGDRQVVGIDYHQPTALSARQTYGFETACVDGAALAFGSGAFDYVCSSHLIEHFVDPSGHVAEISRVLADDGAAFFITPNEPADFENPFHVHLFTPESLEAMLGRSFADVEVLALDGSPTVKEDFERRRRTANRLLKLDVLGLRHRLPRSWFIRLHELARKIAYRVMGAKWAGGATGITDAEFTIGPRTAIDETTLVLFAVCRAPIR